MKIMKGLLIVSILTILTSNYVLASEYEFLDVQKHWAENTIEKFVSNNILNGYSDNTFRPDNNVTFAEFVKVIVSAAKYDLVREGTHVWPDFYINTALNHNLIDSGKDYDFNQYISREEACKIIANFIGVSDVKMAKNKFKDLSGEYQEDILKLVKLEIISGYKDKTFKGENYLTRAEAITIVDRALVQKEDLIKNRKYENNDTRFSNYKSEKGPIKRAYKNTYEIKDGDIYIYDDGRYAHLDGYKFSGEFIETSKIVKLVESLLNESAYVALLYQPSKYTINQMQVLYGDSEEKLACGESDFIITFFENKFYELSRISMENKFSNKVFAKVEIIKLWRDYSDFENGEIINDFKKTKLKEALKAVCKSDGDKICNYMIQKYREYVKGKMQGREVKEHKVFGEYIVDCYKKENGVLTFYLSER